MSTYRLKNLLSPRSVALVGASPRQGSVGRAILDNIGKAKFTGRIRTGESALFRDRRRRRGRQPRQIAFVPELVVIDGAGEVRSLA